MYYPAFTGVIMCSTVVFALYKFAGTVRRRRNSGLAFTPADNLYVAMVNSYRTASF